MKKINVINNAKKELNITVNPSDDNIEIVVNLASKDFKLSSNLKAGDVFKDVDGDEYILMYYLTNGDAVIWRKKHLSQMNFGFNNNYNGSKVDNYLCNTYLPELERKFGKHNIVEHDVDLLSLDGGDDYGKIIRKVSIPTIDEFRHNKQRIENHIEECFWLCTPNSTPSGCGSDDVQCVDSIGCVDYGGCYFRAAVRPRFVLSSSIFKSSEN